MSTQVLPPPSHSSPANNSNSTDTTLPHSRPTSALRNKASTPVHESPDSAAPRASDVSSATESNAGMNISMPARPPPKPFRRANLSLEQNPFEFSFSQSSTSTIPAVGGSNNHSQQKSHRPSHPPTSPIASLDARGESDVGRGGAGGTTTSPKPTLPPLSSLAEPAQESANSFPWGFSSALHDTSSSLRSGPLSPAMLPGPTARNAPHDAPTQPSQPQHNVGGVAAGGGGGPSYFDGHFRTGLTPGIGRTGLTPLVGGPASFPPPSPNTAAFLAMVTNGGGTNGAQQALNAMTAGATITPNTLSALTGTLMTHVHAAVGGGGNDPNAHHAGGAHHQHQQQQHGPSRLSNSHVPAYPPAQAQHPPSSYANASSMNGGGGNGYPLTENYEGAAQHATAAAANGLFLLSQAHQELTKREEQQQAEAAAHASAANGGPGGAASSNTRGAAAARRGSTNVATSPVIQAASTSNHSKRKSTDTGKTPAGKRARGSTTGTNVTAASVATRASGRRKTTAATQPTYGESPPDMDEDMSMDEDEEMIMAGMRQNSMGDGGGGGPASPTNPNKKPETEEEKRKNFLERNRQAALKCRQRKKAWLGELQKRVEFLTSENERLQGTIVSMRDEVTRLSAVVVAHRACGLGGIVVPGYGATAGGGNNGSSGNNTNGNGKGNNTNGNSNSSADQTPHHHGHGVGSPEAASDVSMRSPVVSNRGGGHAARPTSPISVAPVSVPVSVPPASGSVVAASPIAGAPGVGAGGGGGYGY
ncbi:hypothetical protein FRB97_008315 [Tulasnella sp. 331]|nr:hypothetical protein FRB97_008315 [Tulasnella sp. 331]KAG8874668.1 hypothetical protein FRB98_008302 [Tulasnella sp. 332]